MTKLQARCLGLFVVASVSVLPAPGASARPTGAVAVAMDRCPSVPGDAVKKILHVELGDRLLDDSRARGTADESVAVVCDGGSASLRTQSAAGAVGGKPRERVLRLDDFPVDSQPRVVALAALELLAAGPDGRPRVDSSSPEATVAGKATATKGPPPLRLLLAGLHRSFLDGNGLAAWGLALEVEKDLSRRVSLGFDLSGERHHSTIALGRVSGLVGSLGLAVDLRQPLGGQVSIAGGVGARLGLSRLAGEPSADSSDIESSSVVRPWAGPFSKVELQWGEGIPCLVLGAELGHAVVGARGLANDSTAVALTGTWFAVSLAAGARF